MGLGGGGWSGWGCFKKGMWMKTFHRKRQNPEKNVKNSEENAT